MIAVASPNIAFIKYWGKLDTSDDRSRNLATNPSLSMTLSEARTETEATRLGRGVGHVISINDRPASATDVAKVSAHVARVLEDLGLDPTLGFRIDSRNNFPQGTGIASSASAFAALTLAIGAEALGAEAFAELRTREPARVSALARRGSGSACRSLDGAFVKWDGRAAHPVQVAPWPLLDTILIFSEEHKKVPSSEGHALAKSSPAFAARLLRIPQRLAQVEAALGERDLQRLGPILEEEALELHEIAASSSPPVTYLTEESTRLVRFLHTLKGPRSFYFTLDAGPNVHLISEKPIEGLEALLKAAGVGTAPRIWRDRCGGPARVLAPGASVG